MANTNLELQLDMNEVQKHAQQLAALRMKEIVTKQINEHFAVPYDYCGTRHSPGLGYQIVQQKVDAFLLSPEFERVINEVIARIFPEVAADSLQTLMRHRTRKILFAKAKETPPPPVDQNQIWTIFWRHGGKSQLLRGATIEEAFTAGGYGAGAIRAIDFYGQGDLRTSYRWDVEARTWRAVAGEIP